MKPKFVDCFMLMGAAMSLRGGQKSVEVKPPSTDVLTTFVNLSLTVQEMRFINIKTMEFQMTALLNQYWMDPRLSISQQIKKMAVGNHIWRPKITNINGENKIFNNDDSIFWRVCGDNGNVLLSEKIILRSHCTTNFKKFPFDMQICEIKFGSYRFPIDEVELVWNTQPIEIFNSRDLFEFTLSSVATYSNVEVRPSGNFSILSVQFIIARKSFHYVICTMLPCVIVICLTYLTFWIGLSKRSIRFNINITCFAFLLYFSYTAFCTTQSAPYLKSLDVFVGLNVIFAMTALVELSLVDIFSCSQEVAFHINKEANIREYPRGIYWAEVGMRTCFPVLYIFALLVYCIFYI